LLSLLRAFKIYWGINKSKGRQSIFWIVIPVKERFFLQHIYYFINLIFSIPDGVCFNSHKKSVIAGCVLISFIWRFWATSLGLLWLSEGLSESRVSIFMYLEEPDDGHNRPKLVAQNLQIKEIKTELAVTDFFVRIETTALYFSYRVLSIIKTYSTANIVYILSDSLFIHLYLFNAYIRIACSFFVKSYFSTNPWWWSH
jgi:hypothetical protein